MPPKREESYEKLTVQKSFRVPPVVADTILDESSELGMNDSEYIRLCVFIAGPLLRSCPVLKYSSRTELKKLMQDFGNTIEFHPASFSFRKS